MPVPLTEAEIERLLPVWVVLSDTFLDTELDERRYAEIAESLLSSGYSLHELERIYRGDVAPAFVLNLWGVAGEWQGWTEESVRSRVLRKRTSVLARFASRIFGGNYINSEWQKISRYF
ncbi:hypothetical protein N9D37_01250 [Erythrobacter sp.]|nr:hypothetical protein [Erythrobacter sp.]